MSISPLKTPKFRIVFACSWLIWAFLHGLILRRLGFDLNLAIWDSAISNTLLALVTMIVAIILQYYIPQKNKYGFILALCTVLSGFWFISSRAILMIAVRNSTDYTSFFSDSMLIRLAIAFLLIGCMALVSVLWYTIQDQHDVEQRKTETDKLSKEAELYKLRQQLQPHFLFNSLNSINALIGSKPEQARTMIQQLSDFLRGTLKKEDHQWISLDEELQHLQLYLEIEKVRFGHRLSTVVENDTNGIPLTLPVMLLQPLVENAIKFGLYDTIEALTISLQAKYVEGYLHIEIKNPFDPETTSPQKGTGFGLSSVQRRLYLLFGRTDLLQTFREKNVFITLIKIPQQNDQGNNN